MTFKIVVAEKDKHFKLDVRGDIMGDVPVEISSNDERELRTTSKVRTYLRRMAWAFYVDFKEKTRVHLRAIWHNLANTRLQIEQTTERYTRRVDRRKKRSEQIEMLSKIIAEDPTSVAKDLLYIEQRAVDLDAQLIGINVIVGKRYDPKFEEHNLRDILIRCIAPFYKVFEEKSEVVVEILVDPQITLETDFRLFNCALYHFLDNCVKYVRSQTVIKVYTESEQVLVFQMTSRALEEGEEISIFNEGVTGKNSKEERGEGLGMYVFEEVLARIGARKDVLCHRDTRLGYENHMYQLQEFKIIFDKSHIANATNDTSSTLLATRKLNVRRRNGT